MRALGKWRQRRRETRAYHFLQLSHIEDQFEVFAAGSHGIVVRDGFRVLGAIGGLSEVIDLVHLRCIRCTQCQSMHGFVKGTEFLSGVQRVVHWSTRCMDSRAVWLPD